MEKLYQSNKDVAEIYIVYISEAHAEDDSWPVPYAKELGIKEHKTFGDRCAVADRLVKEKKLTIPCLIDNMDNAAADAYQGWPDRVFLIRKDGRLAVAADRGPWGFKPGLEAAEKWLAKYKTSGKEPALPTAEEKTANFGELERDLYQAYQAENYKKALRVAEKMHEQRPKHLNTLYNTACLHCLLDHKFQAYEWLEKAVKAGYRDVDHLLQDSDFERIRDEARFKALAARMRSEELSAKAEKKPDPPEKRKRSDAPAASAQERAAKVVELTQELVRLSEAGKPKQALEVALEALEKAKAMKRDFGDRVDPLLGQTMYNVACMYSLLDNKGNAFECLFATIDHGKFPTDLAELMEGDPDLDNIRKDPRFARALRMARSDDDDDEDDHEDGDDDDDDEREAPEKLSPEQRAKKIDELTQEVIRTSNAGERKKALEVSLEALKQAKALRDQAGDRRARPRLSLTNYNVACMYSLLKDKDNAFKYLGRCVELGPFQSSSLADLIEEDKDFDHLREDARYKKILRQAERASRSTSRGPAGSGRERTVDFRWKATLPEGHDRSKAAPLLVALHHFNGSMHRATLHWREAASAVGAILLTPQGTISNGDTAFHWGRDLDTIEENIMDAINEVIDAYKVDEERIVLAGFSQGGWATWALAMRNPETFRGIIPVAGMFKPESENDLQDDHLKKLRVFIMVGEEENPRTLEANRQAAKRFGKIGASVKLNEYEGVGHGFPDDESGEQIKALRFILEG